MATVTLCFLIVISASPTFCNNGGVFDKIKEGLRNAQNYFKTAKDIADLVAKSLNRKGTQKKGDDGEDGNDGKKSKRAFGAFTFVSTFFRLLGLDTQKITAIAVNSVIFLAQLIGSLFELNPQVDRARSDDTNDDQEMPDPYKFIIENKSEKIQKLVNQAHDETLPEQLIERLDGSDTSCIKLLICKTSPIINAAQISLKNRFPVHLRQITSWLPTKEQFEDNSETCEQNHTECLLFPTEFNI
ncbi:uncharacterized protein LOC117182943 [Belonocnema kinseyi]|uniref:uncharacterized protein LOC117182943 n=1 Tax=Belonocnema kinseyi TaxID=2817044 RepID=UPI00143CE33C|nr:uncharacterized protein LOC117182943 [Belonocnema kinseyi]